MSVPLIDKLTAEPIDLATARLPADKGGVPAESGFYAWWLTDEIALPTVPTSLHPTDPGLGLVYLGIAPNGPSSEATLCSRILNNHLGNALGSSTLRRGLAALLWEQEGWQPFMRGKKPAFQPEDNTALTSWMDTNLLVSWCRVEQPWSYEAQLISEMLPPLNSDHNHSHPFYSALREARKHLMAAARAAAP